MIGCRRRSPASREVRPPAVAGSFYPSHPARLRELVDRQIDEASRQGGGTDAGRREKSEPPLGLLVPHAGLAYSGSVAAAAWRRLGTGLETRPLTVLLLGTNHVAPWLDGVGVWDGGPWQIPGAEVDVDDDLAGAIAALGRPFAPERLAHAHEHSIEVQLPFLAAVAPGARLVALAVSAGTGDPAIEAGRRLGALVATWQADRRTVVVISSDMAHYPDDATCASATAALEPAISTLDPEWLADAERTAVRAHHASGLVCGMCGIEPAVLGLATLRAAGAGPGRILAAATSADAGGPADRTVGYLAVEFPSSSATGVQR